ncbi:MAG: hypothetical protein F9K31_02535 [Dokdonella sp.]|nr:MAG: hypothetical protein F9K31_02535 [Dokdonella sp.]
MFKLDQSDSYWYPVQVEMTDAAGRRTRFSFEAQFERLPQSDINEIFRVRGEDEPPLKDSEVLDRVLRGWRGVQDAEGRELEVTPENRAMLLEIFPVPASIIRAFLKSIGWEGKAKN